MDTFHIVSCSTTPSSLPWTLINELNIFSTKYCAYNPAQKSWNKKEFCLQLFSGIFLMKWSLKCLEKFIQSKNMHKIYHLYANCFNHWVNCGEHFDGIFWTALYTKPINHSMMERYRSNAEYNVRIFYHCGRMLRKCIETCLTFCVSLYIKSEIDNDAWRLCLPAIEIFTAMI